MDDLATGCLLASCSERTPGQMSRGEPAASWCIMFSDSSLIAFDSVAGLGANALLKSKLCAQTSLDESLSVAALSGSYDLRDERDHTANLFIIHDPPFWLPGDEMLVFGQ